jgi:glycosyltransferase involved in cell wall biosynthesis
MRFFHDRIQTSPFKERIEYKGFLDHASYHREVNAADILCMPRIDTGYAHAGFPFKLGEFLATGKPVIASAVSDVPAFLEDRKDAILVPPGASEAIVEAVDFLIDHPEKAFEMGACGKEKARHLFDYRKQGEALLTFFSDITS